MSRLDRGTFVQPEEYAYPAGGQTRRGRAVYPDGRVRQVFAGIPDTYFSIPAHGRIAGRYVAGYLTVESESGSSVPLDSESRWWAFRPTWKRCASRYAGATIRGRTVRCEGRIDPADGSCSAVTRDGRHGHSFAARYWTDDHA